MKGKSVAHENRDPNFEAHNLARHMSTFGVGRHLWLDIPYSYTITVNIVLD
jgi:hypothetical protein